MANLFLVGVKGAIGKLGRRDKGQAKTPAVTKTALLPPVTATRMAWAMTGLLPKEVSSQEMGALSETDLQHIEEQATKDGVDARERAYVRGGIATMRASMRSLDTIYKGRVLNFQENEKLRLAYLETVKEALDFGKSAQDFLKSLPTMTISAAAGVTVGSALGLSDIYLWAIGLGLAGAGYLVNVWVVRWARRRKQTLYVSEDYERTLYYEQYVGRVRAVLQGLLSDLEYIHHQEFGTYYGVNADPNTVKSEVTGILSGVEPAPCPYVHKHMQEGTITPERWAKCESGFNDVIKECPLYKKEQKAIAA